MAGLKAPFFALKEAKNGQPYLVISQGRSNGEGKDSSRISVIVFPDHLSGLLKAVKDYVAKLQQDVADQTEKLAAAGEKMGQQPAKV